jgi:addiction module RelB/DinJ family antitoxin
MNKDHMIRVRVDKKTKEAANLIFKKHGINMSIAIRMYLHHIVNKAQQK